MQVQCLNRKVWVAATPEEIVRQGWLTQLELQGFPRALIAVEKELSQLTHLNCKKVPTRRADILCFAPVTLQPLVLIECKAVPLTQKAVTQALAYNHFVQARFVAIVNQTEIKFGYPTSEGYKFVSFLPLFNELKD